MVISPVPYWRRWLGSNFLELVILPSISLLLVLQQIQLATEADTVVAVYHSPALGAFPPFLLLLKKLPHAIFPDAFQILNHAHLEIGPIPFVELTKVFAGEISAFIAELYLTTQELMASLLKEGTLFISRPASGAVWHLDSLALHIVCKSKISTAYSAIHSARCD
jgi:hypothetical protein